MSQDKRFKGKLSDDYDLFSKVSLHEDEIQETVAIAIKEYFANKNQEIITVLELGSGTGLTTSVILNSDKRTIVTAVDNEKSMMNQINEKMKKDIEKGRVKPIREDCLEYLRNIDQDSFDVFASAWTLHNFNKDYRKLVLEEIYRVLKKGGFFVNADKYALDNPEEQKKESKTHIARFAEFERLGRPDLKEKWTQHYLEDEKPEIIMIEGEAISQMEEIGFMNIKIPYRKSINATITAEKH
ncbi:MAG: class I SAM-dependent methyltransferase [Nanoarchaeota archaeon]